MIFPGMDPYLEDPVGWPSIHSRLMVYLADQLQSSLGDRYIADVQERVYVEGPDRSIVPDVGLRQPTPTPAPAPGGQLATLEADAPDVEEVPELEIHETFIAIVDPKSGNEVVTVIEVVSPTNKYAGPGREMYIKKQTEIRQSKTHLIEIDLLRAGPHVLAVPEWLARRHGHYHYLTSVNRAVETRRRFELYRRTLRQQLPRLRVPLASGDGDTVLDLQAALIQLYEAGRYRRRLKYDQPCVPPLSGEDRTWADQLIQQARQAASQETR